MEKININITAEDGKAPVAMIVKYGCYMEWNNLPRRQQILILRSIREWYGSHESVLNEK